MSAPALTGPIALTASAKFYADSNNPNIQRYDVLVPQGISPKQMIALINHHQLFRYRYNQERSGCMHWCKTVLNMLMTQNIIDENELRRFERFVTDIRRNYSEVYSIPYDRGDFLNENGRTVSLHVEPRRHC